MSLTGLKAKASCIKGAGRPKTLRCGPCVRSSTGSATDLWSNCSLAWSRTRAWIERSSRSWLAGWHKALLSKGNLPEKSLLAERNNMLAHLIDVSIRSLLLAIAAAGALLILRNRRKAALQHAVWTMVVSVMLALFAFGQAMPRLPLRILTRADAPAQTTA